MNQPRHVTRFLLYQYYLLFITQIENSDKVGIQSHYPHGETFYINFYYSIFQSREKRITLRISVSKITKLYNNDMKLQHSSQQILLQFILKFHIIIIKFSNFTDKNSQSDTFFPRLKNTIVKINIKSFSVRLVHGLNISNVKICRLLLFGS